MGGGTTSWYSNLQRCLSTLTVENGYYALNKCVNYCLWYYNVIK